MRLARGWPLAAGALVLIIAGGAVAATRGDAAQPRSAPERGPALTTAERRELVAARPLVEGLQTAINEVPVAASDAAHGRVSVAAARARIGTAPALGLLSHAGSTISLIASAYDAALSGSAVPPVDQLATAVNQLSTIEGDALPAVRIGATTGNSALSTTTALDRIETDPRAHDLAALIENWSQVYGALALVEQVAPQN